MQEKKGDPREQCERYRSLTVIVSACRHVAGLCLTGNMQSRSQSSNLPCCTRGASVVDAQYFAGQHLTLHWSAFGSFVHSNQAYGHVAAAVDT